MLWADGNSAPIRKLVYDKTSEGPLLETGKTIEHAFGPAAVSEYRISLRGGEYCDGNVEQKGGAVNIAAYGPGGARIHSFGGPSTENRSFALDACGTVSCGFGYPDRFLPHCSHRADAIS